eukprot:CAMPEP_0179055476 /NCGR_PEP_ID=MMETSP0796-20121207/23322_1 /TAXON_ID=73915 /ORGANISM="Pyrodinium bahamense, Strain pbaha01" /LENGTH=156 /DNA_ID=CAMNT_0020752133 /DNA_START=150 /DNA_END=617 /DNA_ORIENTATION=-
MKDNSPCVNWLTKTSLVCGKCLWTLPAIFTNIIAEWAIVTSRNTKTPDRPSHFRTPATQPAITPEKIRACANVRALCWSAGRIRNSPSSSFCCTFPFLASLEDESLNDDLAPGLLGIAPLEGQAHTSAAPPRGRAGWRYAEKRRGEQPAGRRRSPA